MKNPFVYAAAAALYIIGVVFVVSNVVVRIEGEETIFIPMVMISLLVLSVAIMGFLFFFEPLRLFLDDRKKEAVVFFGRTLGTFAAFVVLLIGVLLYIA